VRMSVPLDAPVHWLCKSLSRMFHLFLYTYVANVSSVFFCMLQVLHLDILKVDQDVTHVAMVFQLYVPNVSSVFDICYKGFIRMLQK
jgi:hypothetical protein